MINIKKSEIKALLTGYQTSIKERSFFRSLTGFLPDIIKNLKDFVSKLNPPEDDQLTSPQLYALLTLLLNREIRTHWRSEEPKLSELLAQQIEEKFEESRMDFFSRLQCNALSKSSCV